MKAMLYRGTYDGQVIDAHPDCSEIQMTQLSTDPIRYVRAGGSTFTIGAGRVGEDEQALFVHASALDWRSDIEVAIEAFENGY
jgi:hypothetical protein